MFSYLRACGLGSLASPGTIRLRHTTFAFTPAIAFAIAVCQIFITSQASAQLKDEPIIFDVHISLPMEPDEPTYHDFYINAGPEAGFKKGTFVNVVREVPVHDPIGNKQQATLNIKIGRLQIIHVERNITVARLEEEFDDDDRPTVDYESVMIGDRIDTTSITSEQSGQKKKPRVKQNKTAEAQAAAPVQQAASSNGETSGSISQSSTDAVAGVVKASATSEPKASEGAEAKANAAPQKIPNVPNVPLMPAAPPAGGPSAIVSPAHSLPPKSA